MPKGFNLNPGPRHTEVVARESLRGLVCEALNLSNLDDPQAWDRIAEIGQEIRSIGSITADALRRRAPRVDVSLVFHGFQTREVSRG